MLSCAQILGQNSSFYLAWMQYHISGSLVVRVVFLPFEESSYTTFARCASGLCLSLFPFVSFFIYFICSASSCAIECILLATKQ